MITLDFICLPWQRLELGFIDIEAVSMDASGNNRPSTSFPTTIVACEAFKNQRDSGREHFNPVLEAKQANLRPVSKILSE